MVETALSSILFLAGVILAGGALSAHYRIHVPTADSLGIIAGGLSGGAFLMAVGFALEHRSLVLFTVIVLGMLFPVLWLGFSVEYVGREEFASKKNVLLVSMPVMLGLFATFLLYGMRVLPWFELPGQEMISGVEAIIMTALTLLEWFGLLYAGGLLLAGCGVILWAFQRYEHLDSATGILLGTFGVVPWLSLLFGLQLEGTSMLAFGSTVSIGLVVGGVACLALVGPYPLFAQVPSAGNIGPKRLIDELTNPVLVTDRDGMIVEANRSTRSVFDQSRRLVGQDIGTVLSEPIDELQEADVLDLETINGRVLFAPTVSRLSDHHGQLLGYGIVLRDLTDETTRRQLLEVFNRVLRHHVRNDMTVILGHAELIRAETINPAIIDSTEAIFTTGTTLSQLSEKVREAERVLDVDTSDVSASAIKPLVESVFDSIETGRDPQFSYEGPETAAVEISEDIVTLILRNLVGNAVEHHDREQPRIEVNVRLTTDETYPLQLAVVDDGPGIPRSERRVIEKGSETQLEHGSGLGLWIVQVATTKIGGKLTFSDRSPHGTIVTVDLPASGVVNASEPTEGLSRSSLTQKRFRDRLSAR